jgi:hypothetical protein
VIDLSEFDDLRSQALRAAGQILDIADQFPKGHARSVLRSAADKLKIIYVYSRSQKKTLILAQVSRGNKRITDMSAELLLCRAEIEDLLKDLLEADYICERREMPAGGMGRPYRVFDLSEKGERWTEDNKDFFTTNF